VGRSLSHLCATLNIFYRESLRKYAGVHIASTRNMTFLSPWLRRPQHELTAVMMTQHIPSGRSRLAMGRRVIIKCPCLQPFIIMHVLNFMHNHDFMCTQSDDSVAQSYRL
jgi:hypothetical protein